MGITQEANSLSQFEVRFESLFDTGRGLVFPCDGAGRVDLDTLSESGRNNYFYARAMLGMAVRDSPHRDLERSGLHERQLTVSNRS